MKDEKLLKIFYIFYNAQVDIQESIFVVIQFQEQQSLSSNFDFQYFSRFLAFFGFPEIFLFYYGSLLFSSFCMKLLKI